MQDTSKLGFLLKCGLQEVGLHSRQILVRQWRLCLPEPEATFLRKALGSCGSGLPVSSIRV